MVAGFVLQYKWLLKVLKGQIIIVMICVTVSKEHEAQTGFLPSLVRLCTLQEGFQEYPLFKNLLKKHTQAIPTVSPLRRATKMIRGLQYLQHLSCEDRLRKLGLLSLEKALMRLTRTFQDLKEAYNKAGEELQRHVVTGLGEMAPNQEQGQVRYYGKKFFTLRVVRH